MFAFPPLSVKAIIFSLITAVIIGGYFRIQYLENKVDNLQLDNSILSSSLEEQTKRCTRIVSAVDVLEQEKQEIEESFSSVNEELTKYKKRRVTNACPSQNENVVYSEYLDPDLDRVLKLSDCKATKQCGNTEAPKGRVHHIYTPE